MSFIALMSALPQTAKATNDPVKLGIGIPLVLLGTCFTAVTATFVAWCIHEKKHSTQFGNCSDFACCLASFSGTTAAALLTAGSYLIATADQN